MDYVALGNRISSRRRELGLTQETLAEKTYKSASFIGHCERGTRIASVETLVSIANALDTSVDELLADSIDNNTATDAQVHEKLVALSMEMVIKIEKLYAKVK